MGKLDLVANDNAALLPAVAGTMVRKLEAVGLLTAGVAHDFKNVLATIGALLRLLDAGTLDPEKRAEALRDTARSVDRGMALTQQLLAFCRTADPGPGSVDLAERIDGLRSLIRLTVGADVSLNIHVAPGPPAVRGDAAQLELALLNLIANARDAMGPGGVLAISAVRDPSGASVRLSVSDTGRGMDGETLCHATERFYTTKVSGAGTGLGLWLVHRFAMELGGGLSPASEPGLGTTVTLWIPTVDDRAAVVQGG